MSRQPVHAREEETSRHSQGRWFRISPVLVSALSLPSPASMLALQFAGRTTDPIWPCQFARIAPACTGVRRLMGDIAMSWKTINQIIGLASINPAFRQQLQQDPQVAFEEQEMTLTPEELEVFKAFASLPFGQLCQCLLKEFAPDGK